MAQLDPILMVEVASATAWPEQTKYTKILNVVGGTPTHDSLTHTTTVTIPAAAADPPGWHDLANIDFTALETQAIEADGLITLGSLPAYVYSYAYRAPESTLFGVVNGSGLRLPGCATGVASNTEAAKMHPPGVRLFFKDLENYSHVKRGTRVRVVAEAGANYSSSSGYRQGFGVAIGDTTATGTQATGYHIFGGTGGTTPVSRIDGIQGFGAYICGGAFTEVSGVTGFYNDNVTLGLDLESLCSVSNCRGLLGGVGVDCIEDPGEVIPCYLSNSSALATGSLAVRDRFVLDDWAVHIYSFAEGQMATAYSFIKRIRIQAWY